MSVRNTTFFFFFADKTFLKKLNATAVHNIKMLYDDISTNPEASPEAAVSVGQLMVRKLKSPNRKTIASGKSLIIWDRASRNSLLNDGVAGACLHGSQHLKFIFLVI